MKDFDKIDFHIVQDGEEVLPVMDDYLMQCCDCGLVHTMQFRAIEIKEHHEDGSFSYDELPIDKFRVQIVAKRGIASTPSHQKNLCQCCEKVQVEGDVRGEEIECDSCGKKFEAV